MPLSGNITTASDAETNDAHSFTAAFWLKMPLADQSNVNPSILASGNLDGFFARRFEVLGDFRGFDRDLLFMVRQGNENNPRERELSWRPTAGAANDPYGDEWVHITVRHDMDERRLSIYANGSLVETRTYGNQGPSRLVDAGAPFQLGGYSSGTAPAEYQMDEFRFFGRALDSGEIEALSQESRVCFEDADAFIIDAPANASVCGPAEVTITAVDANGNPLTDYQEEIAISTSSNRGVWSVVNANGSFSGGANDGLAGYQFVSADQGSITLALENQSADDLVINVAEVDGDATGASDLVAFRENAFQVQFVDSLGQEIVAGRPHAMEVSALRQDPDTGECGVNANYDGNIGLRAWIERSANDPGGLPPEIAGESLPDNQPGGPNIQLGFDAGTAEMTLDTEDVGQYRIALLDVDSGLVVDEEGDPRPVSGESSQGTARPFGFAIDEIEMDGTSNPGGTTPAAAIFGAAGELFSARVMAVQYQPAADSNDDGVPDDGAVLTATNPTPAFAANGSLDRLNESGAFTPQAGNVGTLTGGTLNETAFSGGSMTLDDELSYDEVGSITLEALVSNYLGAGLEVTGRSSPVGRFTPDRFQVELLEPATLATACNAAFSYLGQDIPYGEAPSVRITPVNVQGTHTQNYARFATEDWWRLEPVSPSYHDEGIPTEFVTSIEVDDGVASHAPDGDDPTADQPEDRGRVLIEFTGSLSHQFIGNNSPDVTPFSAAFEIRLDVIDEDGIAYEASDGSNTFVIDLSFEDSDQIRHGRLNVGNAHGSDRLDLAGIVRTEYYQSEDIGWLPSTGDGCTENLTMEVVRVSGAGDACIIDPDNDSGAGCPGGGEAGKNWSVPPEDGDFNAWFRATNEVGSHVVRPTDMPEWLRYDWSGQDNGHDETPEGTITFGIFDGENRRIDLREAW
ncbi:DUF6701 domain-containing protein [Natronospira elongata]|uniref:DUF6701 domain-containing protein n=1 Tax=Natronospira elongata TaxID=3110268 RepID=UPI0035B52E35